MIKIFNKMLYQKVYHVDGYYKIYLFGLLIDIYNFK